MALPGIIRRWHLRDQISLREIAKRLGISRNTVRRYLRSEIIEPAHADRRPASVCTPSSYLHDLKMNLLNPGSKNAVASRCMQIYAHWDLKALMIALPRSLGNGKWIN